MTDNNDLWELDRQDYVNIVTELRADLAEAEQERDEAVRRMREHAEHVNFYGALYSNTEVERRKLDEQREFYKDELAKAQVCADEMAALAWKWKYKADCQRETIRALVVVGRGMYYAILRALVGWGVPPSDKLAKQATTRIKYGIMRTREAERE